MEDFHKVDGRRKKAVCQHGYAQSVRLSTQVDAAKLNAQNVVHLKKNTRKRYRHIMCRFLNLGREM